MERDRLWVMVVFQIKRGREVPVSEPNICERTHASALKHVNQPQKFSWSNKSQIVFEGLSTSRTAQRKRQMDSRQAAGKKLWQWPYKHDIIVFILCGHNGLLKCEPAAVLNAPCVAFNFISVQRQTDKLRDRQRDRRTERQMERQTERQMERQMLLLPPKWSEFVKV